MQPVFNFQGSAMLSVMAFAGTVLLLFALACVAGYLVAQERTRAARRVGWAVAGVIGAYALALAGFSMAADEREVAAGGEKYFCELDCHLAYSIAGVERFASSGTDDAAPGLEVVNLRVRFDPQTVGPGRDDRPLHPTPRRARLIASDGRAYAPSEVAREAVEARRGTLPALDDPLRPGESVIIPLAFTLPAGARGERLLLTERSPETWFLIGHENSFFHPRTAFRLDTSNDRTAQR
jgi:hypothetical protein